MKISTIIIDDERDAVNFIRSIIQKQCPELEIVGEAFSAREGELLIREKFPDLVFLDVEMPMGSGFDLLARFPDKEFDVIFITAFDHYAVKAIKFSAFDYILKPIRISEFIESVQKYLQSRLNVRRVARNFNSLLENLHSSIPAKLAISVFGGVDFLTISEIIRIEGDGSYCNFFMKNGKKILVSRNLKEFHELLNEHSFFRIHNSHLINLKYVKRYLRAEGFIELEDGAIVPVSKAKRSHFLHLMSKPSG